MNNLYLRTIQPCSLTTLENNHGTIRKSQHNTRIGIYNSISNISQICWKVQLSYTEAPNSPYPTRQVKEGTEHIKLVIISYNSTVYIVNHSVPLSSIPDSPHFSLENISTLPLFLSLIISLLMRAQIISILIGYDWAFYIFLLPSAIRVFYPRKIFYASIFHPQTWFLVEILLLSWHILNL